MTDDIDYDLVGLCKAYIDYVEADATEFAAAVEADDADAWPMSIESVIAFDHDEDHDDGPMADWWREEPDTVTDHVILALADVIEKDPDFPDDVADDIKDAGFKITGYDPEEMHDIGQYAPNEVSGRVVHLRGQITKRSDAKLRIDKAAFQCVRCQTITYRKQTQEDLEEPHECRSCERDGPYTIDDSRTQMSDFQTIRMQTLPEEAGGTDTEEIDVRLYDDLVGQLVPGDRAIVTAEVGTLEEDKGSRVRTLYGDGRDIVKLTSDHTDIDVEPYKDDINEIVNGPDPYGEVIESIAPFHVGDDDIKEALAYLIFGGIEKEMPDGSWQRGNSHVLLMGDPGTGKSTIIKYVAKLVPRSEVSTGKRSSAAGLTAAAVKDDFSGGWSLQAGTLVRAHNGVAVIDELDKMEPDDREGMLDAMSEQEITVSMVVSGTLPAKCSVLAAANPEYGSFDTGQPIGSQIDLDSTLISRFDLRFMMVDEPNEDADREVADAMTENAKVGQKIQADQPLTDADMEVVDPPIDPETFRAYVALGKRHFPVFTDDAHDRIVEEYVDLRQLNDDIENAPISSTARQVGAIHRQSEASARIRLAEEVTEDDVERAISILYTSMESMGIDPETGAMDARRFESGTATSQHEQVKAVKAIIKSHSENGPADADVVLEEASVLMGDDTAQRRIDQMKRKGDIYEPNTGTYELT